MNRPLPRSEPLAAMAIQRARAVRKDVGYEHPTELPIEVLAHIRNALVRPAPTTGGRANIVRLGTRAIISVADRL